MWDGINGGDHTYVGVEGTWETSIPSFKLCYDPKLLYEYKILKKTNTHWGPDKWIKFAELDT